MKKFFKWTGIVLLGLLVFSVIYGLLGLKQTLNLDIQAVDLTQIPDGTYTGNYDCYRWSTKVEVTVKESLITGIKPIKIQDGRDDIVKDLIQRILDRQRPNVDAISGATASSKGFLKAVETALRKAYA